MCVFDKCASCREEELIGLAAHKSNAFEGISVRPLGR